MPTPRPAPRSAPPAAVPAPTPAAPTPAAPTPAAPSIAPDPFRLLPEIPEGISLRFTFGANGTTVTARACDLIGNEVAGSGPVMVTSKDPAEDLALAAAVAIYNACPSNAMADVATPKAPGPEPAAAATPAASRDEPAVGAATILQQIAALPSEWQDYLSQMYVAQYGFQFPGDDTMAITQEQIDFLASLLPQ